MQGNCVPIDNREKQIVDFQRGGKKQVNWRETNTTIYVHVFLCLRELKIKYLME